MNDKQDLMKIAKTLHDVINEIIANDHNTQSNLIHLQRILKEWINKND